MWDTLILNPMMNLLLWIYSLISNFGITIILFTILIRLITHPLTVQQIKGQQKMAEFQKSEKYQELQKKYKDDKQKLQQEQAKLIQEMGVNPLGSCLPTLIQLPIMFGLYGAIIRALATSPTQLLDLKAHVYPFFNAATLIPINKMFLGIDLSQPERTYIMGIGIPVLAIIVVATTYLQSKLMTPATSGDDQSAAMSRSMNLMMPVMMGMFALSFAAGLAVYFVASNVITIIQYALMGKVNWYSLLPKSLVPAGKLQSSSQPTTRSSSTKETSKTKKPAKLQDGSQKRR